MGCKRRITFSGNDMHLYRFQSKLQCNSSHTAQSGDGITVVQFECNPILAFTDRTDQRLEQSEIVQCGGEIVISLSGK